MESIQPEYWMFFWNQGIHFDGVNGVSAGALHGCSFVSGQKGRSLRYIKKYRNDKHFMSWWSFLHTGEVVGRQFCYHDIPERLDPFDYEAFIESDTAFYATCTNVETGKAEYIKITDMMTQIDAMRASASMPYVSKIVNYKGMKLLDGGCADSIPVEAFKRMGYDRIVVVLTRETGFVKKPENTKWQKYAITNIRNLCIHCRTDITFIITVWMLLRNLNGRVRYS